MTERARQYSNAIDAASLRDGRVYEYNYLCMDGNTFSVVASTEAEAFRVLKAERPDVIVTLLSRTFCDVES